MHRKASSYNIYLFELCANIVLLALAFSLSTLVHFEHSSAIFVSTAIYINVWGQIGSCVFLYLQRNKILSARFSFLFLPYFATFLVYTFLQVENADLRSFILLQYCCFFALAYTFSLIFKERIKKEAFHYKRILFITTTSQGEILARSLQKSSKEYMSVCLVLQKKNMKINKSTRFLHYITNIKKLPVLIKRLAIDEVLIMDKPIREQSEFIYRICDAQNIPCSNYFYQQILSSTSQNSFGLKISRFTSSPILDIDQTQIHGEIQDKTILITGAGGSIGKEVCKLLFSCRPQSIILLEISEEALYEIDYDLRQMNEMRDTNTLQSRKIAICPHIGDIRDDKSLHKLFETYDIQMVFHCAAYKHVPLMEFQPKEAVYNNVMGTYNLANMSRKFGIEKFILVSTDKAINPCSVMGATKRVAELYVQSLNGICDTRFMIVRFGNVIGSSGSVIPLFEKQITAGGPVTITHPDVVRYFMTPQEAASLLIQTTMIDENISKSKETSQALRHKGDIFMLEMGDGIYIKELAEEMIRARGLRPHLDIELKYIGLRPGEKLHEELIAKGQVKCETLHKRIYMVADSYKPDLEILNQQLEELFYCVENVDYNRKEEVDQVFERIIPEFQVSSKHSKSNYKSNHKKSDKKSGRKKQWELSVH